MEPIRLYTNSDYKKVRVGDFLCVASCYKESDIKYKVLKILDNQDGISVMVEGWFKNERLKKGLSCHPLYLFEWIVGRENSSITDKMLKITVKRVKC